MVECRQLSNGINLSYYSGENQRLDLAGLLLLQIPRITWDFSCSNNVFITKYKLKRDANEINNKLQDLFLTPNITFLIMHVAVT